MGYIFNRESNNDLRRRLRNNIPNAEIILWAQLKGKKINGFKFRRQYGIGPFVVDFYCPELRLAIEVDGDSHFLEGSEKYDKQRQKYIEKFGIKFLRFMNTDIYENLDGVIQTIFENLKKQT